MDRYIVAPDRIAAARWDTLRERCSDPQVAETAEAEARRVLQPWQGLSSLDILRSLLVQIAVIGNARSGYRFGQALREPGLLKDLIAAPNTRAARLHAIARSNGVRFVGADMESPKVRAWCGILAHPKVTADGVLVVRENLQTELGTLAVDDPVANRQAREALMSWRLPMIGRKSWSDWLNNRGLTRHLLAIDTRLVGIWRRYLDARERLEDFQDAALYDAWERACEHHLAQSLAIHLSDLDKRLFVLSAVDRLNKVF